jgi:hypothetical protein
LQLANLFAIDAAAYAVMSNHYHIVVRIDVERAAGWSLEEVLERWMSLFTGPVLVQRYLSPEGAQMTEAQIEKVRELAEGYRERLTNLSWFMRILNENIAREANREDGVKGRFWEGRFKSQALLDEAALLSAMAYVDLNPIRGWPGPHARAERPHLDPGADHCSDSGRCQGVRYCASGCAAACRVGDRGTSNRGGSNGQADSGPGSPPEDRSPRSAPVPQRIHGPGQCTPGFAAALRCYRAV